jgi:peptidoglycan/LPS O-acetylase OafA/YrhL
MGVLAPFPVKSILIDDAIDRLQVRVMNVAALRFPLSRLNYVPEFDGLRALAVFAVIARHTMWSILPGGEIGVDVFFVLSGFLITRVLLGEFEATDQINFINFYVRRCLRLMPALWLFLSAWILFALVHGGENENNRLWAAVPAGLYFMNWTIALDLGPPDMLRHTWSLAVEEQFYLLWPPLLFLALKNVPRRSVWLPILLLLLTSSGWRGFLAYSGADQDRVYNGFDTRAETLLFGCLLAVLPIARFPAISFRLWYIPVAVLISCLFFLPLIHVGEPAQVWKPVFTFGLTLVSLCAAWVIVLIIEYRSRFRIPVLTWRPVTYVGRISYGIYLWHYPINMLLRPHLSGPFNFIVTGSTSVLIAAASFHLVEARALRLKKRFSSVGNSEERA